MRFAWCLIPVLALSAAQGQELRVIATHAALSEKERSLLSLEKAKLPAQAAALGFTLITKGEDLLLYDKNLYDLESMEKCIRGHAVVAELLRAKKFTFKMKDLPKEDRDAVRQLFLQGGRDQSYGPVVYNDDMPIRLQFGYLCDMEDKGSTKRQTWAFEDNLAPPVDTKSFPSYSQEDIDQFIKEDSAKRRKPTDINHVILSYGQKKIISVERRMSASQDLLDAIRSKVADQIKAYRSGLKSLEEAYSSPNAPKTGMTVKAMDGDRVTGLTSEHFQALGFSSKSEAEKFIGAAKFTGVRPCVRFEMGYRNTTSGRLTEFSFDTWVNRGG
jgi:hypothetical protein